MAHGQTLATATQKSRPPIWIIYPPVVSSSITPTPPHPYALRRVPACSQAKPHHKSSSMTGWNKPTTLSATAIGWGIIKPSFINSHNTAIRPDSVGNGISVNPIKRRNIFNIILVYRAFRGHTTRPIPTSKMGILSRSTGINRHISPITPSNFWKLSMNHSPFS